MKKVLVMLVACFVLVGCRSGTVSEDKWNGVKENMSKSEVEDLLGKPKSSTDDKDKMNDAITDSIHSIDDLTAVLPSDDLIEKKDSLQNVKDYIANGNSVAQYIYDVDGTNRDIYFVDGEVWYCNYLIDESSSTDNLSDEVEPDSESTTEKVESVVDSSEPVKAIQTDFKTGDRVRFDGGHEVVIHSIKLTDEDPNTTEAISGNFVRVDFSFKNGNAENILFTGTSITLFNSDGSEAKMSSKNFLYEDIEPDEEREMTAYFDAGDGPYYVKLGDSTFSE